MSATIFVTRESGKLRWIDSAERSSRPLTNTAITLGAGELTRSSAVATITRTGIGLLFKSGDKVLIAGAAQTEYNGIQTLSIGTADTVTFAVAGTPASPGTGTITVQDLDYGPAEIVTLATGGFTPGATYAASTVAAPVFVLPNIYNGFDYEVTSITTGVAGTTEPTWPTTVGQTVVSTGATFTCRRLRDVKWIQAGVINRPTASGPAHIVSNGDAVTFQSYFVNGQLNRDDGPAHIVGAGSFAANRYFLAGNELDKAYMTLVAPIINDDSNFNAL